MSIKYFCDLCAKDITEEPLITMELDKDDTKGFRRELPPNLHGRLHEYMICCGCASNAVSIKAREAK